MNYSIKNENPSHWLIASRSSKKFNKNDLGLFQDISFYLMKEIRGLRNGIVNMYAFFIIILQV